VLWPARAAAAAAHDRLVLTEESSVASNLRGTGPLAFISQEPVMCRPDPDGPVTLDQPRILRFGASGRASR